MDDEIATLEKLDCPACGKISHGQRYYQFEWVSENVAYLRWTYECLECSAAWTDDDQDSYDDIRAQEKIDRLKHYRS